MVSCCRSSSITWVPEALIRISIRDTSSLVRPMLNVRISYEALTSMILSKIAERRPESIRCPSASIVSLAAKGHSTSGKVEKWKVEK